MPDNANISPFPISLRGGLVLNQTAFEADPGAAQELENFEPDNAGGYKRILGYTKWLTSAVPYTALSSEKVLMTALYATGEVLAARGESVYRGASATNTLSAGISNSDTTVVVNSTAGFSDTGTLLIGTEVITYTGKTSTDFTGCTRGALSTTAASHITDESVSQYWTEIESGRTGAKRYSFFRFNFDNTEYLIYADGANNASVYDGSSVTSVNGTGAPADPQWVTGFKNQAFFTGMSAAPNEILFTAPYTVDDFDPANGAGSIAVDCAVTALIVFRGELYIFGAERIYKLSGNTASDFILTPVTKEIGCRNGFTVQEFAGDIVFLGPDGLRTVAATDRIGDVDLGTISSPVQERFENLDNVSEFDSLVIPGKTQYRLFLVDSENISNRNTRGIVCVRRPDRYEFSETKGIQPSSTDFQNQSGQMRVVHGGFDGFVYLQESGNTFDGEPIIGRYRSQDITMGDAGIRKAFNRIIINYKPTGILNTDLLLRYDYEDPNVPRPAAYPFDSTKIVALYGSAIYGVSTYGGQNNPLVRQPVEGSGFAVAIRVIDTGVSAPYTLKGFQLEFDIASRR